MVVLHPESTLIFSCFIGKHILLSVSIPFCSPVVKGEVQELSVYSTGTTVHVLVSHNSSDDKRAGANWMTTFEVSDDVIRGNEAEELLVIGI